jgi:hypothetical protein
MKVRDPNRGRMPRSRGGADAEKMALDQIQFENAIKTNPLFPIVVELKKQVDQSQNRVDHMLGQMRSMNVRFSALLEYMADAGLLLAQDLDADGVPTSAPYSKDKNYRIFENLPQGVPKYGFSTYYVEYEQRTLFLLEMMTQLGQGVKDMDAVIELVREFNADPNRIVPIAGVEFGLENYLSKNPDNWDDEKCNAVAEEFGLTRLDEGEDGGDDSEGENGEEAGSVSIEEGNRASEDDV